MEPSNNDQLLHEIYRLSRANNELLHHMRRTAFFWGFVKFIIYVALLIAPVWFYFTYLNGAVQQMLQTVNRMQGASSQAQTQFSGLQSALQELQQLESRFGGATSTSK